MSKSTKSPRRRNKSAIAKPYADFPLTAHQGTGRWCKRHNKRTYYFGKLDDWQGALERYQREWPYIVDGRTPPPVDDGTGCTIKLLVNTFLDSKDLKLKAGELSERSFRDYHQTCQRIIEHFGRERRVDDLRPADFERFRAKLAEKLGTVSLKNEINRCRVVFKYAYDNRLIPTPVVYGQSFDRPSAKALRQSRHSGGQRMFEAAELRRVLTVLEGKPDPEGDEDEKPRKPDPVLRAMLLLGLNCGFGNTDVASLPQAALLSEGWVVFPRPKTGIPRRVPLWPETVAAIREALAVRPKPADRADAGLVFLTRSGCRWVRVQEVQPDEDAETTDDEPPRPEHVAVDPLSQKFSRLLHRLGINGRRGLGFYTARHVFQTIAGDSKDPDAVSSIMGHADASMAAVYRERISDDRLRAVVETVRTWLWPAE